jgi:ribonuclease E
MSKKILIDGVYPSETRVVLLDRNNDIEQFEYQTSFKDQIKGNIYLAKVTRIEPSLQAAFIDYGEEKNGFLPFSEIHPSYYQVPHSDKSGSDSEQLNIDPINPPKIDSQAASSFELDREDSGENNTNQQNNSSQDEDIPKELRDEDYQNSNYINLDVDEEDLEHVEKKQADDSQEDKNYKIQEVLKKGQIVLVQAQKEERGNKGASFTTFITLAGRYCVLMPNKPGQSGISKRISKITERKKLRSIVSRLSEGNNVSSIIIRTAGIGRSFEEIKRDYDYLIKLWNQIREVTLKSRAPNFIHVEEDLIQKAVRDLYDNHTSEILIQGNQAYQDVISYMDNLMLASDEKKVKLYDNKTPLFTKFNIEEQISRLYQPIVNLPSGGYVVINPTEALIAVDVNSGRATSERCIEETALKTNLEAAKEIARQLRLRDLSGLLVLDFIDMYEVKNRKIVERCFKDYLSHDRARIQVGYISSFGLLQMSRQRLRPSFLESNTAICHQCNGKGLVRADESNAMVILRTIENEIYRGSYKYVNVFAALNAVLYITNNKRDIIDYIEGRYNVKINFYQDPKATADSFSIEKIRRTKKSDSQEEDSTNVKPLIKPQLAMAESARENPYNSSESQIENTASNSAKPKRKKWKNNNSQENNNAENLAAARSFSEANSEDDMDVIKTHEPDNFKAADGRGSNNSKSNSSSGRGDKSKKAGKPNKAKSYSSKNSASNSENTTPGDVKAVDDRKGSSSEQIGSANNAKLSEDKTSDSAQKLDNNNHPDNKSEKSYKTAGNEPAQPEPDKASTYNSKDKDSSNKAGEVNSDSGLNSNKPQGQKAGKRKDHGSKSSSNNTNSENESSAGNSPNSNADSSASEAKATKSKSRSNKKSANKSKSAKDEKQELESNNDNSASKSLSSNSEEEEYSNTSPESENARKNSEANIAYKQDDSNKTSESDNKGQASKGEGEENKSKARSNRSHRPRRSKHHRSGNKRSSGQTNKAELAEAESNQ